MGYGLSLLIRKCFSDRAAMGYSINKSSSSKSALANMLLWAMGLITFLPFAKYFSIHAALHQIIPLRSASERS
eukprot:CAMPEP_0206497688 /NCGR_PEP_ID=MMETSP0324_2-20121206/50407_1 /ASSEMBLY_ACC=CAM_ASM_000836 /TAXON_ID=2866 /ORGANISM="Crypthecodinium cohnii, Strain Seligo" /LENGTH=72 /DNA_ID=CAMNT_0053983451 /DNA_START=113 /DNA_END=327 /DNA_ORIENTATION=-